MKVLVDTCVIVDVLQNREPFAADAQRVFLAAANKQIQAYVTAKSVTDLYYLTHRLTHSDHETRQILTKLLYLFDVLDTTAMDCRQALASEMSDYEDAVMAATAVRSEMDRIVTRNTKDYAKAQLPVCTPHELIQQITDDEDEAESMS